MKSEQINKDEIYKYLPKYVKLVDEICDELKTEMKKDKGISN